MPTLQPGQIFDNKYKLLEPLGVGGFAEVWKVKNLKAEIELALKVYRGTDERIINLFRREYARFFDLQHRNILIASHFDVVDNMPYIVMRYCSQGSAEDKKGKLKEEELAKLMKDIASALEYLHDDCNPLIIHRDIKPDNILLNDRGDYLLADFGISAAALTNATEGGRVTEKKENKRTFTGITPMGYQAPELFGQDTQTEAVHGYKETKETDIWAFGATLYEVAAGRLPFGKGGGVILYSNPELPTLPDEFSPKLSHILQKCMAMDPKARPKARELKDMASYYLTHGDWPVHLPGRPTAQQPARQSPKRPTAEQPARPVAQQPSSIWGGSLFSTQLPKPVLYTGLGLALALSLFVLVQVLGISIVWPDTKPEEPMVAGTPMPPADTADTAPSPEEEQANREKEAQAREVERRKQRIASLKNSLLRLTNSELPAEERFEMAEPLLREFFTPNAVIQQVGANGTVVGTRSAGEYLEWASLQPSFTGLTIQGHQFDEQGQKITRLSIREEHRSSLNQ